MIFLQLLNRSKQKKTAFFYFFFHLFLCTISRSFRQHTIGIIKKTTCAFSNCTIIFLYVCFSTVAVYGISQHATQRSGKPTLLFFFTFVTWFFFCFFLFCFVNLKSIEPFMANFTQLHSSTSIIQFKQMNTMKFSMIICI